MPGCCVPLCSNHSRKGWRLFRFPSDPNRRSLWIAHVKRDNWQPTKASNICSAHFVESSFEQRRADGWKKLKPNAVPTVFPAEATPKQRKPPKKMTRPPVSSMACQGGALPTREDAAVSNGASSLSSTGTTLVWLASSTEASPEQDCSARTSSPSNSPGDTDHSEGSAPSPLCGETTVVLSSSVVSPEQDRSPRPSNSPGDRNRSEGSPPAPLCSRVCDLQSANCSCAELAKQLADMTQKFNQLHDAHSKANATIQSLVKKVHKLERDVESIGKRVIFSKKDQVESLPRKATRGRRGRQSSKQFR